MHPPNQSATRICGHTNDATCDPSVCVAGHNSERLIDPGDSSKLGDGSAQQQKLDEFSFALDQFSEAFDSAINGTTVKSMSGNFKAVYDRKLERWSICDKQSKRIGSRKLQKDVVADLASLDAGTHKSQLKGTTEPVDCVSVLRSARIANNSLGRTKGDEAISEVVRG